jgi:hypothetical protein
MDDENFLTIRSGAGLALHCFCGIRAASNASSRAAFRAFHRQIPAFFSRMAQMLTKYKMLWFLVDLHHRQR